MDSTTKAEDQTAGPDGGSQKDQLNSERFTSNMRVVVIQNKRNAWVDEAYDTPPDMMGEFPVFH